LFKLQSMLSSSKQNRQFDCSVTIMLPHTKVSLRMPIDKYVFQSV
jgi:hypothetical protein